MSIVNNIDLSKLEKTINDSKGDKSTLRKRVKLHGEWNLDPAKGYQFRTELNFEKGKQVIEIDSPPYLGGNGNRLGPMAYCIAGVASCFISTFATVAAASNVDLSHLSIDAECSLNFSKTLGLGDEPIVEDVTFDVHASGASLGHQRLEELLGEAEERCPAIFSLRNMINVTARISS
jgi:uncharacterized OsmC-like protein